MHRKGREPLLLVDDDRDLLFILVRILQHAGYLDITTAATGREARELLSNRAYSLVVLDIDLPDQSGLEIFAHITGHYPDTSVIFLTAASRIETVVDCMRLGACDYLAKPPTSGRLIAAVDRAIELHSLRKAVSTLEGSPPGERLDHEDVFAPIVTRDPEMRKLFRHLEVVSPSDQPVLIAGETGAGKELFARAVHDLSGRKGKFVAVNVAGLDDLMVSDSLFGHLKGAYTGAEQTREGLVAAAGDGTLFLDEIGDLGEQSQIKLLRLLQENEYYPLGADTPSTSRVRIVLATHQELERLVEEGKFRKDLYYRIRVHRITVPPLRQRPDDIPLLLERFLGEAAAALGKKVPFCPPEVPFLLAGYAFPGNVRELQAMVHDAVAHALSGKLSLGRFRAAMAGSGALALAGQPAGEEPSAIVFGRFPSLKEAEEHLIAEALRRAGGNQGIAAGMLGITRQALNNRLRRRPRP